MEVLSKKRLLLLSSNKDIKYNRNKNRNFEIQEQSVRVINQMVVNIRALLYKSKTKEQIEKTEDQEAFTGLQKKINSSSSQSRLVGYNKVKRMGKRDAIGKAISQEAQGTTSKHKCFQYVRRAIQKALGQADTPSNIKSAKDAGPWLQGRGFEEVDISGGQYQNGDVMVIEEAPNHPDGHIQGYYNGHWYSDFKQKTPNPWINCQIKAVYRYSNDE